MASAISPFFIAEIYFIKKLDFQEGFYFAFKTFTG